MKKTCPICKKEFTPKSPSQICDTKRCTYIRLKLDMPAAKSMTREEAISYYNAMYDDPLRRLGKTKYRPLIRAIYDYCEEHDTKEFIFSELPEKIQKQFSPRSLLAVAARPDTPIRQTKEKIKNARRTANGYGNSRGRIDDNMTTKIGITGTHGSGKSTKAKELFDRFVDVNKTIIVVDEVARSCPHTLGTVEAQEWIWTEQMTREKHAMTQDVDVIICDRTVMDNLMYYRDVIEKRENRTELWSTHFFKWLDLYREAIAWMPTYTQVIRLPLNLEWLQADDPIRPKDVKYARRIDALFDRFVDSYVTGEFEYAEASP